jgi:hypothetical protein
MERLRSIKITYEKDTNKGIMKYCLKSVEEYDNDITKKELLQILGIPFDHRIKAYDCALPQQWLDKYTDDEYDTVRFGTLWIYAGGEYSFGFPFPIIQEAYVILKRDDELSEYAKAMIMIEDDVVKILDDVVGYECSMDQNILILAKSLNNTQYTRICRIAGIPVNEIRNSLQDKIIVLKSIVKIGDTIPNGKKEREMPK